ncbi:MAG: hypothetical protein DMG68_07010 [Acidobacteria bacterium]|nr:MAG: hypothetical protein DMG68_07010 [Acidobacteriota bacterium]
MRLDVNLASQPYEDTRQFWMRWGTGVALIAILTLGLVAETIVQIQEQIASRDRERAQAEAFLNRPENRTIRDRSQFLNDLIERKAFSWTQVFEDLERVMPARIHVVSIRPEVDEDNQLEIKLQVAGESRERVNDLVRKMEESPRFKQPQIKSETQQSGQAQGDNVEFAISALYVPSVSQGAK